MKLSACASRWPGFPTSTVSRRPASRADIERANRMEQAVFKAYCQLEDQIRTNTDALMTQ
jgi:hypothetical protein